MLQTIIINWKRPQNLAKIIKMVKKQTSSKIYIVDNHPSEEPKYEVPRDIFNKVDDIFRWNTNTGPPSRFVPALLFNDADLTLFHDDDVLLGHRALIEMLKFADEVPGFSTIGMRGQSARIGRRGVWLRQWVVKSNTTIPVDITTNLHLVKSRDVPHAILLKWQLIDAYRPDHKILLHDDIILCCGIQRATGYRSYMIGSDDAGCSLSIHALRADHVAFSADKEHHGIRSIIVSSAYELGWRKLAINRKI